VQHSNSTELLCREEKAATVKAALTMITPWCSATRKNISNNNQPAANRVLVVMGDSSSYGQVVEEASSTGSGISKVRFATTVSHGCNGNHRI